MGNTKEKTQLVPVRQRAPKPETLLRQLLDFLDQHQLDESQSITVVVSHLKEAIVNEAIGR